MTMLTVFGALRNVVRTNAPGEVHLSSVWSALHHRVTAVLLLFLMLLVSARQYLGEPVQCIQQKDDPGVPERVMNTYCFIATTYTVVRPRRQQLFRPSGTCLLLVRGCSLYSKGALTRV